MKDKIKIAVYSRKSKFTGRGESIENQVEMCKDYIFKMIENVQDIDIDVYEDEGISGKTLNRPQFQEMMKAVKSKRYQYLVVYRLDRISRNVGDFSNLIEELNALKVSFISIKEQFDTSTPMGRAMMSIASVFAQLERETIAERVRDNAYILAKTGRWLGGVTALGFTSQKISSKDENGKVRIEYKLSVLDNEMEIVKLIFAKFLEVQSLTKVETYLMNHEIKSRKGSYFTKRSIKKILENPVYCDADYDSYQYFNRLGCQVCCDEEQLGKGQGFIGYHKTESVKDVQKENNPSEWIIAIGRHKSIINSNDWLKSQEILLKNKPYGEKRKVKSNTSLLSGKLICGNCDAFMRPKAVSSHRLNDKCKFDYICELKEKSKKHKCDICNVNGVELDNKVCEELFKFNIPESDIAKQIKRIKDNIKNYRGGLSEIKLIDRKITESENIISNLLIGLAKDISKEMIKRVDVEVQKQEQKIKQYQKEKDELIKDYNYNKKATTELEKSLSLLEELKNRFNCLTVVQKRSLLDEIIHKVIFHKNGTIDIFINGSL